MSAGGVPHLWEVDHPYYCNEGNYYSNGLHDTFDSWTDFFEAWGGNDADLNLVFRWDWKRADPSDYEYELAEDPTFQLPGDTLLVFWVLQRKAILRSTECVVTEADEPAVREWLATRALTIRAIWDPLLTEATR